LLIPQTTLGLSAKICRTDKVAAAAGVSERI
jgi:hypothetical protein